MNFFGFFRRRPPIHEYEQLADFIDEQSAFLMQKGIYDYAQARAGHYTKVLFKEGKFVEGVLRPHAAGDRRAVLDPLIAMVLSIFDRYPVPPSLGRDHWQESRSELANKLSQVALRAPKRVFDIPEPYAQRYFDLMPFHKELLTRDMPTARSYLKISLTNIHDELIKRMDAGTMAAKLRAARAASQE